MFDRRKQQSVCQELWPEGGLRFYHEECWRERSNKQWRLPIANKIKWVSNEAWAFKCAGLPKPPKPLAFAIGSNVWPGLSKLIEESGEVQQVAGKIIGWGGDVDHPSGDLMAMLEAELADLVAAIDFVIDKNHLDRAAIQQRTAVKRERFEQWHRGEPA